MSDAPSGWKIQTALAAWHLERLRTEQEAGEFEPKPSATISSDLAAILGDLLKAWQADERMLTLIALEERDLDDRKKRFATRAERRKTTLRDLMLLIDERRVELPTMDCYIRRGSPAVHITSAEKVPDEYKTTTTTTAIDIRKLAADMKVGVVVEGAELSNGAPSIVARKR